MNATTTLAYHHHLLRVIERIACTGTFTRAARDQPILTVNLKLWLPVERNCVSETAAETEIEPPPRAAAGSQARAPHPSAIMAAKARSLSTNVL